MREKRLIDAYALADKIHESNANNPHTNYEVARNHRFEHEHFLKMVCCEPTVDAVEVVRCKDCKECGVYTNWSGKEYWGCTRIPDEVHSVDPDHFCSYGERRMSHETNNL